MRYFCGSVYYSANELLSQAVNFSIHIWACAGYFLVTNRCFFYNITVYVRIHTIIAMVKKSRTFIYTRPLSSFTYGKSGQVPLAQ